MTTTQVSVTDNIEEGYLRTCDGCSRSETQPFYDGTGGTELLPMFLVSGGEADGLTLCADCLKAEPNA